MPFLVTLLILLLISLLGGSRLYFGPSFSGPQSPYDPPDHRRKIRIAGVVFVVVWLLLVVLLVAGMVTVNTISNRRREEAKEKAVKAAVEEQQRREALAPEPVVPKYGEASRSTKHIPLQMKYVPSQKKFGK